MIWSVDVGNQRREEGQKDHRFAPAAVALAADELTCSAIFINEFVNLLSPMLMRLMQPIIYFPFWRWTQLSNFKSKTYAYVLQCHPEADSLFNQKQKEMSIFPFSLFISRSWYKKIIKQGLVIQGLAIQKLFFIKVFDSFLFICSCV